MNSEYCTMTELAKVFVGQTRNTIGKALKKIEMRWPNGKPTPLAHTLGLVEPHEGPQPWVEVWWWHRERTITYLEKSGMRRCS
jgi:hypothetical protein